MDPLDKGNQVGISAVKSIVSVLNVLWAFLLLCPCGVSASPVTAYSSNMDKGSKGSQIHFYT